MIVIDSLFPVFFLVVLGVVLKRYGFTSESFLRQSDRLIYYIFFPVMLFWKIGGASYAAGDMDLLYHLVTLLVLGVMFVLSALVIRFFQVGDFQAGTFSQSCYRFNTYIGMAVVLTSQGAKGVAVFGILIGLAIPLINVFAVSALIWFSGQQLSRRGRGKMLIRALAGNPLILGCLAGFVYSRLIGTFPLFVTNALSLMSMVTLPLALISIGGALTFAGMKTHLWQSVLAATLKLCILPLIGYGAYQLTGVGGVEFKVGMIFFSLPTSTAIYVLSSQLNSDTELASSAIVLSTVLSFFSLSVALLL
ncbi:MAG: AEC family transporter [Desulfopila sp.]